MMESARKKIHSEAAQRLLRQTRLPEDQVEARLKQARSPAYWESLNPQLSVSRDGDCEGFESAALEAERQAELLSKLAAEGFFQIEPLFSTALVERLREAITSLRRADWPAVFAFVYDEFWQVARTPSLAGFLAATLGAGYKQLPHVWGHYVPPHGGAGWGAHIDGYKKARRLTVWIALSEATLESSCMYLIPKNLAPREVAAEFTKIKTVNIADLKALLSGCRALPVRAGAILGWEHDVIHWGSLAGQSGEPRISISMEFIGENLAPARDEHPLLDAHRLPTFAQRLLVIGQAIDSYHSFEPLQIRYLDLARRLLAEYAETG